ncbi:MAG: hypothetical protein COV59_03330 [Candidatus Magasanikbacteria bacterium CG11_big_fil_rev_8_21_14_0_20_39_34]|uniref:FCP1 homology domain-containing protein n=1 Tax=Candidatus Magasanikbacteria bacterium CG11_big_fil_rev_8_21_14_0_20_39_34 TaxID=1974653 RepID=A0A2H0N5K3_9BACT|nr:MAG: hypothetical protein COV59_03330 [Candidatus Magasanikbacteria bacterium CG11_big_fil_rev_8_21_14_0_20_39_34]
MLKAILSDLSRTLLFPVDENYTGKLNALHESLKEDPNYDIHKYFFLNEELLSFYKSINKHIDIYMFTTKYIQEWPPLKEQMNGIFKDIFSGARLNLKKDDPEAYNRIAEKIGLEPSEILFIDDSEANTDAAKEAGLFTILFESKQKAIIDLKKALENSTT